MSEIRKVAIVGAGTMGSQIALQAAYSGHYRLSVVDSSTEQLQRAEQQNQRLASRAVERGRRSEEVARAAVAAIAYQADLAEATADADL
ncbi:MAG: 3-hydroxyacyl-CoA dehydrogenase NAD-binding domain-containing protein, partial [Candidatus Dormibacteraceae bacterium]